MKRVISFLLSVVMILSLVSCKQDNETKNVNETQKPQAESIEIPENPADSIVIPEAVIDDFTKYITEDGSEYNKVKGLMAVKKDWQYSFNGKVSYPFDMKAPEYKGVIYADAENFVKMFDMDYTKSEDGNSATITLQSLTIEITAGKDVIKVNGNDFSFPTVVRINDTILIAACEFATAMGYTISCDADSGINYFYSEDRYMKDRYVEEIEENSKLYEEIVYNYEDVECDQTGVGLYEKSKPEDRLVGIAYTTWCRPMYPWTGGNYWSLPLLGKYSSDDPEIVRQHGIWLAEADVDFVFIDWSNNTDYDPVVTGSARADFAMIERATNVLFEEWAKIPNAPKICIFVGPGHSGIQSVNNGNHQKKVDQVYDSYIKNEKNKDMYFHYEGKPLLMCYGATPTQYGKNPEWTDDRFTIRWVTGFVGQQGELFDQKTLCSERYWSWEEREAQTYTVKDGVVEAVTCSAATRAQGGAAYIPAHGRENGMTLKTQFQRAIDLGAQIVLVVSWNEWTRGEQPSVEISKDIEPSEAHGTYYYDLMRELIKKFKGKV